MSFRRFYKYAKSDLLVMATVLLGIVLLGVSLFYTVVAWHDCGFTKSMLYGKNLVWAWYWGYC